MRRFSLRQQIIGDLNEELNRIRSQINKEVREKCYDILAKKSNKQRD